MTNITKDTQFRVIGTKSKSPLVYIDEVAKYINAGGGGGQSTVTVNDITDATTVGKSVLLASTQVQARTALGAGTSNLTIGTTATTAKAGDYAPPNASTAVNGLMLTTDKAKLDTVATGATKNQPDVTLLNRAYHTGTQPISSVTGVVPIAQIPTGSTATTVALGNHTHAVVTATVAGLMSGVDKTKLDNLKGVTLATRPTITITDPPTAENIRASFNTILNYIDAIIGR